MAVLVWNEDAARKIHFGVSKVALYVRDITTGTYPVGVVWNGAKGVDVKPGGAEETKLYANNEHYNSVTSREEVEGAINAYTYPDEFALCDGSVEPTPGVYVSQQMRHKFGLAWQTEIGDGLTEEAGYIIHVLYGCKAKPSEQSSTTINESVEAVEMSWEFTTTALPIEGLKNSSYLRFDSTKVGAAQMALINAALFGSELEDSHLPLPDALIALATP